MSIDRENEHTGIKYFNVYPRWIITSKSLHECGFTQGIIFNKLTDIISLGECNTILSAYTLYRHLG